MATQYFDRPTRYITNPVTYLPPSDSELDDDEEEALELNNRQSSQRVDGDQLTSIKLVKEQIAAIKLEVTVQEDHLLRLYEAGTTWEQQLVDDAIAYDVWCFEQEEILAAETAREQQIVDDAILQDILTFERDQEQLQLVDDALLQDIQAFEQDEEQHQLVDDTILHDIQAFEQILAQYQSADNTLTSPLTIQPDQVRLIKETRPDTTKKQEVPHSPQSDSQSEGSHSLFDWSNYTQEDQRIIIHKTDTIREGMCTAATIADHLKAFAQEEQKESLGKDGSTQLDTGILNRRGWCHQNGLVTT